MRIIEIKMDKDEDLEKAHAYASNHREKLENDSQCGCFYCKKIFHPSEIREWFGDRYDDTALCPYCGIDSVIGESSGYPITEEFLAKMKVYWFQCGTLLLEDE